MSTSHTRLASRAPPPPPSQTSPRPASSAKAPLFASALALVLGATACNPPVQHPTQEEALAVAVDFVSDFERLESSRVGVVAAIYPVIPGEDIRRVDLARSYEPRPLPEAERRRYEARGFAVCDPGAELPCDTLSPDRPVMIAAGRPYSRDGTGEILLPVVGVRAAGDYWARVWLLTLRPPGPGEDAWQVTDHLEWFSEN